MLRRKGEVTIRNENSEKQKSRELTSDIFPSRKSHQIKIDHLPWAKCYVWCLKKASSRADAMVNTSEKT